jgi:hypothetical protein
MWLAGVADPGERADGRATGLGLYTVEPGSPSEQALRLLASSTSPPV